MQNSTLKSPRLPTPPNSVAPSNTGLPQSGFHAHLSEKAAQSSGLPFLLVVTPKAANLPIRYVPFATIGFAKKMAKAALPKASTVVLLHAIEDGAWKGFFEVVAI